MRINSQRPGLGYGKRRSLVYASFHLHLIPLHAAESSEYRQTLRHNWNYQRLDSIDFIPIFNDMFPDNFHIHHPTL